MWKYFLYLGVINFLKEGIGIKGEDRRSYGMVSGLFFNKFEIFGKGF